MIDWFKSQVNEAGGGNYQSLINGTLKGHIKQQGLERTLRRLIREELRPLACESDHSLARALWGDPAVARFIAVGAFSEGQIRARLEHEIETQRRYGIQYWPVFLVATGEHIGCCGLRPHGADPGTPEFGVHIASRHWRQGYAFEAAKSVIDHAFRIVGANALFAGHNPSNTASRGLLMRLGFVYTHEEFYEPTGLHHPSYMLTRSLGPPDLAFDTDPNRRAFDRTGEAG